MNNKKLSADRAIKKVLMDNNGEIYDADWFKKANELSETVILPDKFNRRKKELLRQNKIARREEVKGKGKRRRVLYRLIDYPLDEGVLQGMEKLLDSQDPTTKHPHEVTKKQAKILARSYIETVVLFTRVMMHFYIFEPFLGGSKSDLVKLNAAKLIPALIEKGQNIVTWLDKIDAEAADELFDSMYLQVVIPSNVGTETNCGRGEVRRGENKLNNPPKQSSAQKRKREERQILLFKAIKAIYRNDTETTANAAALS